MNCLLPNPAHHNFLMQAVPATTTALWNGGDSPLKALNGLGLTQPKPDPSLADAWRTIATLMAERTTAAQERDLARVETVQCKTALTEALDEILKLSREVRALRARIAHFPDSPAPDYHGPIVDGRPTPDETHERFHESITDVLAGRVMPQAREQMRDALNHAPVPPEAAAKSMPKGALSAQRQNIGLRLP